MGSKECFFLTAHLAHCHLPTGVPHALSQITMPQLSDTMTEGTLVKWHKREGDKVKEGEKVADVETDKATMEMESSGSRHPGRDPRR